MHPTLVVMHLYAFQYVRPCLNLGIYNPVVLGCTKFIFVDFLTNWVNNFPKLGKNENNNKNYQSWLGIIIFSIITSSKKCFFIFLIMKLLVDFMFISLKWYLQEYKYLFLTCYKLICLGFLIVFQEYWIKCASKFCFFSLWINAWTLHPNSFRWNEYG